MATNIGKLAATSTLEARGFQTGALAVQQSAKGLEGSLERIFGSMGASIRFPGFAIGFESVTSALGLQGGRQLVESFQRTIDDNLELGFLNDRLGTSIEWLSSLQTVAGEVSINAEQFSGAMNRLNMRIGEASLGSAEARRSFENLGLEWERVATQGFEQNFLAIAQAMSQVENRSERARLAQELFGRGEGQRMLRLMERGAGGLAEALADVRDRGGFITADGLARIQAADDAFDRVTTRLSGTWRNFVTATAPLVTGALDGINSVMTAIGDTWERMTGPTALARADQLLGRLNRPSASPTPEQMAQTPRGLWRIMYGTDPPEMTPEQGPADVASREAAVERARAAAARARDELQRRRDQAAEAQGMREAMLAGRFDFFSFTRSEAQQSAVNASDLANRELGRAQRAASAASNQLRDAEEALTAERARAQLVADNSRQAENRARIEQHTRQTLQDIDEADRITAQNRTPLEIFNDRITRFRELFNNDNLSPETFRRAAGSAIENLVPRSGAAPLLGSLSAGSSDAAAVIQGAMSPQTDRLAEIAAGIEAMRQEAEATAELQGRLVEWFESGPGAALAAAFES